MSVTVITKDNYESEVNESEKTVILDFWAERCGRCKTMDSTIDALASEHDELKVGKINVEEEPALAHAFRISGIPTVKIMKNGRVTGSATGIKSKEDILEMTK